VKKAKTYFFLWLLFLTCRATAQQTATIPLSFPDSIRIVFENTKNVEATVIGSSFASAWGSFTPDQQLIIQKQAYQLRKKKFPAKPAMINYFGSLANAVNVERADASKIDAFLKVAGKVIAEEPFQKAQNFFRISRVFFQNHALHYEKSFRLYAKEDDYTFDYIAPVQGFDMNDTTTVPESGEEQAVTTSNDDTGGYSPPADSIYVEAPLWMNPPPQPILEGPVLKFNKVSLLFVTKYDSVQLKNTKGSLSFRTGLFVGENGSFDWTSAGLSPDSVYCTFAQYNFDVNKPELKSDLVKLNYIGRTPGAIPGTFEFKSQPRKDSVASSYPRFKSFQSGLEIKGVGDANVRYKGGFSLTGAKISGGSVGNDYATIEVFHDGEKKFIAKSPEFIFTDSTISSNITKVSLLQRNDSITHTAVRMRYWFGADSTQRLMLMKDKGAKKNTPYSASFFNIDFSIDVIKWNLYSDSLDLLTDGGRNDVPMIIESVDFYDPEDFRLLKGEGFSFHPLSLVANYCIKNHIREFYSGELASAVNKDSREVKGAIEFLTEKGMITYDPKTDIVHVKEKAILLYKASKGEMDYDNLKIHSVIDSSANASLNFKEGYMTVRGVGEFRVSDSLNVRIDPDSSVITLLQNRDIKFNGTVRAGNFEISGKGFTLNYDSFFISLAHIDSINFYVLEKNAKGQSIRRKLNNSMVGADSTAAQAGGLGDTSKKSGTLFISRGNNKSGKRKIPNYPRLDASSGGVIYFDRQEVLGGVYDRSMFFVVPPFKLDSLNDADPASINFQGTFVSSGMFPSFKEKLHSQPDKSLGFEHTIPKKGYQLYNGDGKMTGSLAMNNRGLRGTGKIEYLAVTVSSPDFVYYPDSVITKGDRATIEKKQFGAVIFPQASLPDYEMKWYPKQDQMKLKNKGEPFNFYDSTAQMRGTLTISKEGVGGAGKLDTRGTELISRNMNFTANDFSARHGKFRVKSDDPNKPLLTGTDVRVKFNLEKNYADVSPEVAGVAAIDFPFAQFKTSIPEMHWDIGEQKITMNKDPDVPLENSYFYTTRKDLDSLNFLAEKAEYDLKKQELKVSGIPYIIVADAKITPENNEVLILENAKIGTLKNTVIVLDTLNGYHHLTDGVVDIVSRKEFSGYATYQYVNLLRDTFAIKMTDFHLETIENTENTSRRAQRKVTGATQQTVGTGAVDEKENLVLGAGMFYKGDMVMYATRPALMLKGYVKLDIQKIKNYNTWIQYSQSGDETDVHINFDEATTEDGKRVNAGLHFESTDNSLYVSFASDKRHDEDEDFFTPSGTLYYDTASREFKIENLEKAAGNALSGKVFAYKDENQQVRFEGPVKLFNGSKDFNITSTAIGQANMESNDVKMNSLLVVDSNVPVTVFDLMAKQIQDVIKAEGANDGLGDQTELLYKIADIIGERAAKDFEQKSLQGYVSLATIPQLAKPLVFSNVSLKWSPKHKAFYSEGNIGMSNIGRADINGGFEGFMEIRKNEDGASVFHVFVKVSPEAWYYFGYEDARLMIHTSNSEINGIVSKKTNSGKAKVGEVAFIPGTEDEVLAFINKFRLQYYGIDFPYSLSDLSSATPQKEEGPPQEQGPTQKKEEGKDEKKKDDDGF
jgi:hypothetical protein